MTEGEVVIASAARFLFGIRLLTLAEESKRLGEVHAVLLGRVAEPGVGQFGTVQPFDRSSGLRDGAEGASAVSGGGEARELTAAASAAALGLFPYDPPERCAGGRSGMQAASSAAMSGDDMSRRIDPAARFSPRCAVRHRAHRG
ncbi:hypothetical protein ACFV0C_19500 [Streptomyces sp. NPDC059568]|uniref:hypothetical protein n=1 Tax=Streptomyces sp. NPDC059568 TaxID=3346868 RepID=UPI0036BE8BEF